MSESQSHLISYAELVAIYGAKTANDMLRVIERHAEGVGSIEPSNIVYLNRNARWQRAMARLDDPAIEADRELFIMTA